MSTLHGKWSVEDIRKVIQSLDKKTGMNGASIHISLCKTLGNGSTLGTYRPSDNHSWRSFCFSLAYFNDSNFKDLAAIDVIRHEYCHYLVDALNLNAIFDDRDDHGVAWKTVCGLLNTDQYGTYRAWIFCLATDKTLQNAFMSDDIPRVDILDQINRWGLQLPSIKRRNYLEKALIKKFTKLRVFSVDDQIVHGRFGKGVVVDTMPYGNKQMLYVMFEDNIPRFVQNRQVYKVINGQIKKPRFKA